MCRCVIVCCGFRLSWFFFFFILVLHHACNFLVSFLLSPASILIFCFPKVISSLNVISQSGKDVIRVEVCLPSDIFLTGLAEVSLDCEGAEDFIVFLDGNPNAY